MKLRKGDTLIEVALATGIFSLVAVAVVSVVNGSTSSAQSALEVTIAREEIDAQAEALRFIHNSYLVGDDSGSHNTGYNAVWNEITKLAKNNASALDYQPKTCNELYENNAKYLKDNGAFILNTRKLSTVSASAIVQTAQSSPAFFTAAPTVPRVIYNSGDKNGGTNSMADQGTGDSFWGAEGIFIVPIKDSKTTTIVSGSGVVKKAAYYDFYIRTCWFGPGADRPSTISTVVRLYDPNMIEY